MPVVIRPAVENDIDEMYAISISAHNSPFYKQVIPVTHRERFIGHYKASKSGLARFYEKYIARLHDSTWRVYVAEYNGAVAGFTTTHSDGGILELKGLFVAEKFQGLGLGKKLFSTSCDSVQPGQVIILDVLENDDRAIGLYAAAGFEKGPSIGTFYGAPTIQMYRH